MSSWKSVVGLRKYSFVYQHLESRFYAKTNAQSENAEETDGNKHSDSKAQGSQGNQLIHNEDHHHDKGQSEQVSFTSTVCLSVCLSVCPVFAHLHYLTSTVYFHSALLLQSASGG